MTDIASFRLWENQVPGALGTADVDIPTIVHYPAQTGIGPWPIMVIFPGGGYARLAPHEGAGYAEFLTQHGIACFVVNYRLGSNGYHHPVMLWDAARAVRWVRGHSEAFHLDPTRVGVMGSSAGGHLTATLLTKFDSGDATAPDPVDRFSSRPDFGVLCYPVITLGSGGHAGSRTNLLGADPSPELVEALSAEKQVTSQTPPCFLWHTVEDQSVNVQDSMMFAAALHRAGVPFDLHLYERGRHGLGLGNGHPWAKQLLYWLRQHLGEIP